MMESKAFILHKQVCWAEGSQLGEDNLRLPCLNNIGKTWRDRADDFIVYLKRSIRAEKNHVTSSGVKKP